MTNTTGIEPLTNYGLNDDEVISLQKRFGPNIFAFEHTRNLYHVIRDIVKEPMFILLSIASLLYFILGETAEGFMMLSATFFVVIISVYQENRSTKAIETLRNLTEPKTTVIRNGIVQSIEITELVPEDIIQLEEGSKVPADAILLQSNDLTVNESIITGESFPVLKNSEKENNLLYQGTTVNSGKCMARITATGNRTVLGKLGKSITAYNPAPTVLQMQTGFFVRRLAIFGFAAFFIILAINFYKSGSFAESLLLGLTLAMAAIPEEIPVSFSTFMALGAYQMSKLGIISRQPQTIENLGAVSVICLDKTGTITENKMDIKLVYDHATQTMVDITDEKEKVNLNVLRYAMLASESDPFDAMEKAIHKAYAGNITDKRMATARMVFEYPLQGHPPMMTHVYEWNNSQVIAAKGAVERMIRICKPDLATVTKIEQYTHSMAAKGYRVLGVASAIFHGSGYPENPDDFNWHFEGLVSFYDPPKKTVASLFTYLYDANIRIKILTGDYAETVINIAREIGLKNADDYTTGDEVMRMDDDELKNQVKKVNIFARMFPDAKLKVIQALQANDEIVAMTGDGVNDGPALQAADIGIAMGKDGTDIARQASDLVLTDDDLQKLPVAILHGRKIFNNLKKAIRYIISIHIPIILTASLPLLLNWKYPTLFTPIHIIFLEIIMGPTCSVFFEKEPIEEKLMVAAPRSAKTGLFSKKEVLISIIQGIIITAAVLFLYYYFMHAGAGIEQTRMIVFTALLMANIFLTFTNRSFTENFFTTIHYKNKLTFWVLSISVAFILLLHLAPFVRNLFLLAPVDLNSLLLCLGVSFSSVVWFELYKTFIPTTD